MTESASQNKIIENIYSAKVLNAMASSINAQLAAFSSWMVASFGAVLGLLVANIDTVAPFIAPTIVGSAVKLFLVAVVLNVLQRYLSAIVAGGISAGKEIESIPISQEIDVTYIVHEIERATFWPTRILVRRSNRKILSGDIAVGGRLNAKLAQIQGWLVLVQMLAVAWAIFIIANGLKG